MSAEADVGEDPAGDGVAEAVVGADEAGEVELVARVPVVVRVEDDDGRAAEEMMVEDYVVARV